MPFQLVMDEQAADGQEARVSRSSVCSSWGAVAGELRYFADKFGTPRASIEGTQIPMDLVRRFATQGEPELVYDPDRRRSSPRPRPFEPPNALHRPPPGAQGQPRSSASRSPR